MEIIKGKIPGAKKVVVYGPEGIGKSTFASMFPDPLFIDTEGSTKDMDVARTPTPSSWMMLMEQVMEVKRTPGLCQTLVIDTADWAEMLCITQICDKNHKSSIEDFGYGKGYTFVQEEFGRLLNLLEEVVKAGVNVVLTAHAKMRKFEQPDELGAYDRWEMKLTKQTAPMVKEWADMVLFCNYKTFVVNVDGQGVQKGKNKAQGGKRVMYTTHHNCWDAKNRYELPDEVPFEYGSIRHIIEPGQAPVAAPVKEQPLKQEPPKTQTDGPAPKKEEPVSNDKIIEKPTEKAETAPPADVGPMNRPEPSAVDERIPKNLRDLMISNDVCEWDIQAVVEARGYFPGDMPVRDYPRDFVDGCLVGAWDKVYGMIKEMKEKDALVFN
jgi:hypothetical protein|nr:MAG TPA: AAA domain protein [Caudoviricetes sp.]